MKCNTCGGEMTLAPDSNYICLYCADEDTEQIPKLKYVTAKPSLPKKFNRFEDLNEEE